MNDGKKHIFSCVNQLSPNSIARGYHIHQSTVQDAASRPEPGALGLQTQQPAAMLKKSLKFLNHKIREPYLLWYIMKLRLILRILRYTYMRLYEPRSIFGIQFLVINFSRVYIVSQVLVYGQMLLFLCRLYYRFPSPSSISKDKDVSNTTFHYTKFWLQYICIYMYIIYV